MPLLEALNHVIDDGIEAARHDYARPRHFLKREGAIAGFEERRGQGFHLMLISIVAGALAYTPLFGAP